MKLAQKLIDSWWARYEEESVRDSKQAHKDLLYRIPFSRGVLEREGSESRRIVSLASPDFLATF